MSAQNNECGQTARENFTWIHNRIAIDNLGDNIRSWISEYQIIPTRIE